MTAPQTEGDRLPRSATDLDDGILRTSAERRRRQVDLVAELATAPNARIVDLGCGHGHHLEELAARGFGRLTGIDVDALAIDAASARVPAVTWRLGDAYAQMPDCDVACAFFGSFGCGTHRDVLADLAHLRSKLQPGGAVVLDVLNRDFYVLGHGDHRTVDDGTTTVREWCWLNRSNGDLTTTREYETSTGTEDFVYVQRVFAEPELRDLLRATGFVVASVAAGEHGGPVTPLRQRMVVIAR